MLVPTQGLKLLMSQARKLTFTPVMAQVKPFHKVPQFQLKAIVTMLR